jgi:uncharacterized membrane protein YfcA
MRPALPTDRPDLQHQAPVREMSKEFTQGEECRIRAFLARTLLLVRERRGGAEPRDAKAGALGRLALFGVLAVTLTAAAGWLTGSAPHLLVVSSVFLGAVVAGLAGFAFSAIAAALLTHWVAPIVFVPLLLACSITTQLCSIAALWRRMEWRRCAPFIVGGLAGIPLGAALLRNSDPHRFGICLGAFLILYSAFMLLKADLVIRRGNSLADAACGVLGGITAGAIAFPGAAPTVWCGLRGLPKDIQRGVVQPFILTIQVATLAYFSRLGILTTATVTSYLVCAPAVLFGTWIGLGLFDSINDAAFRRVVLIFLIVSGASLLF